MQVGDWGDFQVDKITSAATAHKKRGKDADMEMDTVDEAGNKVLDIPTEDQETLEELAPEEVMTDFDTVSHAGTEKRGVLLDDHHYFSDDETHLPSAPKRLPRGTSAYQAAWFLGDKVSDDGSDFEDVEDEEEMMDTPALPMDGAEGMAPREPTEDRKSVV